MTAAERARRARELHEALNAAFPADNHDIDEPMRVAMLTLSQEESLRLNAADPTRLRAPVPVARMRPPERVPLWRRVIAALTRRRPD